MYFTFTHLPPGAQGVSEGIKLAVGLALGQKRVTDLSLIPTRITAGSLLRSSQTGGSQDSLLFLSFSLSLSFFKAANLCFKLNLKTGK